MKHIVRILAIAVLASATGFLSSWHFHAIQLADTESISSEQFCLSLESSLMLRTSILRKSINIIEPQAKDNEDYLSILRFLQTDLKRTRSFAKRFCIWTGKDRQRPWPLFFNSKTKRYVTIKNHTPVLMNAVEVLAMIVPEMSASEIQFFEDMNECNYSSIINAQAQLPDDKYSLPANESEFNIEMSQHSKRCSNPQLFAKMHETITSRVSFKDNEINNSVVEKNTAANELFSLPELPDGVVSDLARMFASTDEDEVWRDYCLQFLGSALEREDGVTDEDRTLARKTLVEALASTNATFAGTALRALHRGDPADPLVAASALRIARDSSYPSSSRITALLILEDCVRSTSSTPSTLSTLAETASAVSADPSASTLLRRTAEAVLERNAD